MTTEANSPRDNVPAARFGAVVAGAGASSEERRAVKFVAITGILLFIAITPIYGLVFSRGVLVGALLAVANLWLTAQSVRAFLGGNTGPDESRTGASWGTFVVFKLLVLSVGTYLLFHFRLVHGFALIIGLAALPLGVVCFQLVGPKGPSRPQK